MTSFFLYSNQFEDFFVENGEKILYEKNQHLVRKEDECQYVFFLLKGFVRASIYVQDDANRIIGYFVPGAIFAQSGSFIKQHNEEIFYTAESPTTIIRLKYSFFLSEVKKDSAMMFEFLNMTLRNQILLIDRIAYQGEKGLYRKCVKWLLFMNKYYGEEKDLGSTILVPLTQDTIANFLHATRESVNTLIQKLIDEKHIVISKKHIQILNLKKLKNTLHMIPFNMD